MNDINQNNSLLSLMLAEEPNDWELMQHHQKVEAFHLAIRKYLKFSEEAIYLTYNVIFSLQPGSWKTNVTSALPALTKYVNWYEKIKSGQQRPPLD